MLCKVEGKRFDVNMPFDNRLKNMQTPGRVQALCKLLLLDSYSTERVKELLQPNSSDKGQAIEVISLAKKGDLISVDEKDRVHLNIPKNVVTDHQRFQHYLARRVFSNPDFIFGRFTAWVMASSEKVMNETREELSDRFFNEITRKYRATNEYNKDNVIAWMTWANYFGLGHTMDGKFISNPFRRIQTEIDGDQNLPRNKSIPFKQFIKWLGEHCPELDGGPLNLEFNGQFEHQQLSFALSLGLRTLHDLNIIKLETTADAEDIWYLQNAPSHEIPHQVTEIMVKG